MDSRFSLYSRTFVLYLFLFCLALAACSFPTSGELPITISSKTITLEWDPSPIEFPSPPLSSSIYRVYIKRHGFNLWTLVGEIPATATPSFTINHADFGDGSYDFAVSSVNSLNRESHIHSSLDASAYPYGGWYIVWMKSE
jgi:hypothetical protein